MLDYQYINIMKELIQNGNYREGRNGGVYSLFGRSMRIFLDHGFPMLTTKRLPWKSIVVELLWFLKGRTDIKYLHDHGVTIWDEWVNDEGNFGPIYGAQLRNHGATYFNLLRLENGVDQLRDVIDTLTHDPYSRRHLITLWSPSDLDQMALPPCHGIAIQFYVANGHLSCAMYQRSADWFLGVPFNIASYGLLTHLIAREVGLIPGELHMTFGDYHLYANHLEQAKIQMERIPKQLPKLLIAPDAGDIYSLQPHQMVLQGYDPHPVIQAEVSK